MTPRLYTDLAYLWPALSPPEDYAPEAQHLLSLIVTLLPPRDRRPRLLELGAGGGHTLFHMTDTCDCVAVDLSESMLRQCRKLNSDVPVVLGDMRSVRLEDRFDVVLIHDAIDYLLCEEDVHATFATAAAHLDTGGLFFVAPTYTRESFVNQEVEHDTGSYNGGTLTYFSYVHDPNPDDTTFEMILLNLLDEAKKVEVIEDRHTCGLFGAAEWMRWMHEAGFEVTVDQLLDDVEDDTPEIPLFIGVKR